MRAFGAQIGGDVVRGPLPASLGGLPGYEWRLVFAGDRQRTRWVYGYNGRTLHYVECGADTSDARDAESGCERIVDTFTLVRD
ncbi:MAG TPA: hypothetical protein VFR63_09255 [Gaiellaceae bacterium]|nr:hypothetical protein [Gaiellaceae bacterium]